MFPVSPDPSSLTLFLGMLDSISLAVSSSVRNCGRCLSSLGLRMLAIGLALIKPSLVRNLKKVRKRRKLAGNAAGLKVFLLQ